MTQPITNYTTYDQAYYYTDLKRLPRLSREERQHLVTTLAEAFPTTLPEHLLKQQLVESYLPLAKHLAITLCPPACHRRLLPELIGAVNLAVVEAVMRADLSSTWSLDSYVAAYVRAAIKRTLSTDDLLPIPAQARERAKTEGILDQLHIQYRVLSLDAHMAWFDSDATEEPLLTPLLPTQTAPERDPALRTQVDTLLSYLSPRAQAILRLRYGLLEDNERCHTTEEIAALLDLERGVVRSIERDALTRLRAFVAGRPSSARRTASSASVTLMRTIPPPTRRSRKPRCWRLTMTCRRGTSSSRGARLPAPPERASSAPGRFCAGIAAGHPPRPGRANASRSWNGSASDWKRRGCASRARGFQKKQG